ncbi:unnamed protein product [Blepharisma stoltei]|uniref:Uncharacterized protein n=1 Tax=Blepharisma stoltei TaxID=1481888 RepID=A0AAU9ILN4_9CILI|nr:unnamed protein product [Blepharisma stoltei]
MDKINLAATICKLQMNENEHWLNDEVLMQCADNLSVSIQLISHFFGISKEESDNFLKNIQCNSSSTNSISWSSQ